jgi:aldose sugar dehydrogenase
VRLIALVALFVCASSCEREASDPAPAIGNATIDTIARGLEVPWALAFANDGRIFVTERAGRIRVIESGRLREAPWATVHVHATGEAGLMGIALAPDFATSRYVFVVGTFEVSGSLVNRVVRLTDVAGRGESASVIVDGIPAAQFHAGDAVAFGPDGMLYVATGDARQPGLAQRDASLAGKILRYRPDGTMPPDNPHPRSPVYAKGVRNVQGLAWDPATGALFATEHGPSGFPNEWFRHDRDELNAIRAGANYGWPSVAGPSTDRRFVPPIVSWSSPGIAPSGIAFHSGSVYVAALKGQQLRRIRLVADSSSPARWRAESQEVLLDGTHGRLRAVAVGPDGMLYVMTSNRDGRAAPRSLDDLVLRIKPGAPTSP